MFVTRQVGGVAAIPSQPGATASRAAASSASAAYGPASSGGAAARRPRTTPRPSFPAAEARASSGSRVGLYAGVLALAAIGWAGYSWSRQVTAAAVPTPTAAAPEAAGGEAAAATEAAAQPEVTDDDVLAEVQRLIASSSALQESRIEVSVANGIVTLSGEVSNGTARDLAVSLASTVEGVARVFSMVKVTPALAAAAGSPAAAPPAAVETAAPPPAAVAQQRPAPPPTPDPREQEVHELLRQAKRQIDSGDHDGAARTFDAVLRIDPSNPHARDALERRRRGDRPPPPPR
jgi:hypothetical protein